MNVISLIDEALEEVGHRMYMQSHDLYDAGENSGAYVALRDLRAKIVAQLSNVPTVDAASESAATVMAAWELNEGKVRQLADQCVHSVEEGGKIVICGNGGSSAQASHMAAELVVKLKEEREAIPAIALNDPAILTACGNDFGYEEVFRRQVDALVKIPDTVILLSTSGQSINVCGAWDSEADASMWAMITGENESALKKDVPGILEINVPSTDSARIQEATLFIIHQLCGMIEDGLARNREAVRESFKQAEQEAEKLDRLMTKYGSSR